MFSENPSNLDLKKIFKLIVVLATSLILTLSGCKVESQTPPSLVVDGKPVNGDVNGIRFEDRGEIEFKIIEWEFWVIIDNQKVNVGKLLIEKPKDKEGKGFLVLTPEIVKILKEKSQCIPFISFPREKGTTKRPTEPNKTYAKTCLPELSGVQNAKKETIFEFTLTENMTGFEIEFDDNGFPKILSYLDDSVPRN